jgi:hypothetical protein
MKRFLIFLLSFISVIGNSCKAQNEDSTIHNIGSYNAPEIKINDYKMLDYALCKSLSEEEYVKIGTGYIMLGFKIDKKGIVLNVDLLKIKDLIINGLNKSIFILNLKKYVEFNVPTLYHSKDTLSVTILYRKY